MEDLDAYIGDEAFEATGYSIKVLTRKSFVQNKIRFSFLDDLYLSDFVL